MMKKIVYLFCLLTFTLSAYAGEYLVPIDGKMATVSRFGGDEKVCVTDQCYMVVDEAKLDWYTRAQMASGEPEPVLYYELFGAPGSSQWGPDLEGWDSAKGIMDANPSSIAPIVAIIDTGMAVHADFDNDVLYSTPTYSKHGYVVDDGYIGSKEIYDMAWHGTHVAGIIGGTYNGAAGVKGTGFGRVKLLPFMVASAPDSLPLTNILKAIGKIIDLKQRGQPIVAVNMSYGQSQYSQIERDSIRKLRDAGIIAVVAAGNDYTSLNALNVYPANYNVENIVTVTAIRSSRNLYDFANYGGSTSIAAPGDAISTVPKYTELDPDGDGYASSSGTSMATPFVTGAIAAAFALNDELTPQQVMQLLYNSAYINPRLSGKVVGSREIDLYDFLQAVEDCKNSSYNCPPNSYPARPAMYEPASLRSGSGKSFSKAGGCAMNPAASFNVTALVLACGLFIMKRYLMGLR